MRYADINLNNKVKIASDKIESKQNNLLLTKKKLLFTSS